MKQKAFFLFVGLLGASAAGYSFEPAQTVRLATKVGIQKALSKGDIEHLKYLSQHFKFKNRYVPARLAYLESQMKLSETINEGRRCFTGHAIRRKFPMLPIICARYAASAALANQQVSEWAHIIVAAEKYARPILNQKTGKDVRVDYFASVTAKSFIDVPSVKISKHKDAESIPWAKHCAFHGEIAEIKIKINHKDACFVIDSRITTVTPETARRLDLKVYDGNYGTIFGRNQVKSYSKLAVAKTVRIGNINIDNVPFKVVKGTGNSIGSDVLKQLGYVVFTRQGLRIEGSVETKCRTPMSYSFSDTYLNGPTIGAVVNGKPVRITFLSQLAPALLTNEKRYLQQDVGSYARHNVVTKTSHSFADFSLPEASATTQLAMVYAPQYKIWTPVVAGFGILNNFNVELDFRHHKACLMSAD